MLILQCIILIPWRRSQSRRVATLSTELGYFINAVMLLATNIIIFDDDYHFRRFAS